MPRAILNKQHYPIEISKPDLLAFRASNTGIPYVHTLDSGMPGPHVMVNALAHGNEISGAIALVTLLNRGIQPKRGRLTVSFASDTAYDRFDSRDPDSWRFIDEDFNRVWSPKLLDSARQSNELKRARAMRPLVDTVDYLLDLHSMHERCEPLMVCGHLDKTIAMAKKLGVPRILVRDEGHPAGKRLRDYGNFGDPAQPHTAVLIECGQHWEQSAPKVALDCVYRFLAALGTIGYQEIDPTSLLPKPEEQKVIQVTHTIVARSRSFKFVDQFFGLEIIPKSGTLIAREGDTMIRTPYDDCVLVMPSLRQLAPGVTVVRLGRYL